MEAKSMMDGLDSDLVDKFAAIIPASHKAILDLPQEI